MSKLVVAVFVLSAVRADADHPPGQDITVEYIAPKRAGVIGAPADHIVAMRQLVARLEFHLPHSIKVSYRECGSANAFYWAESHTIAICHELWDERRKLYVATHTDREAIEHQLRDAMTYTLFHEFGHALHHELELPLLGNIEDAADELATIAMIRAGSGDAAASAAAGHRLRARQPGYSHDSWDPHASGAQRGFAIACVLYGAEPARYADLITGMKVPALRLASCVRDYPHRLATWLTLVDPAI
jgi:hypothetical protein